MPEMDYRLISSIPEAYARGVQMRQDEEANTIANRARSLQLADAEAKSEAMKTQGGGTVAGFYGKEFQRENYQKDMQQTMPLVLEGIRTGNKAALNNINAVMTAKYPDHHKVQFADFTPGVSADFVSIRKGSDLINANPEFSKQLDPESHYQMDTKVFDDGTSRVVGISPFKQEFKAPDVVKYDEGPSTISELYQNGKLIKSVKSPRWNPKDGSGGGGSDAKEFRQFLGQLDGLQKKKASIQQGYDPITGQVIPQTQISDALKTIDQQIREKEGYISDAYPVEWGKYAKSRVNEPKGDASKHVPLSSAPAPVKVLDAGTAKKILKQAGGNKDKARQIAREQGYKL